MAATGGDITEITYNHPTLGNGVLYPKSNEDSTYDLGGLRSEDDANMVDGGGKAINKINRVRWSFENTISNDMNVNNEMEKVKAMAGDPADASWTFQHVNGTIYAGQGRPVGDLNFNGNAATFKLKVSGGGDLSKL